MEPKIQIPKNQYFYINLHLQHDISQIFQYRNHDTYTIYQHNQQEDYILNNLQKVPIHFLNKLFYISYQILHNDHRTNFHICTSLKMIYVIYQRIFNDLELFSIHDYHLQYDLSHEFYRLKQHNRSHLHLQNMVESKLRNYK